MKGRIALVVLTSLLFGAIVGAQQMSVVRGTGVAGIAVSAPITSTGGSTPNIGCTSATTATGGCVTAVGQIFSGAKTFDTSVTSPSFISSSAATGYLSNTTSGNNAFGVAVNGGRHDFGAGASDYAASDGTTVTFAGPVTATTTLATTVSLRVGTNLTFSATAPTISSGFGASPSITAGTSASFRLNVGTGGSASSGVIGLPTAATGWNCRCEDITTRSATVFMCKQTAGATTSATVGNFDSTAAAAAWVASDILAVTCVAY